MEKKQYKAVLTGDGSLTFHNPDFDETYHSTSGAIEESMEKFVRPSIKEDMIEKSDSIKILDICFGLGFNSCAALDFIRQKNTKIKIDIVGLENDPFLKEIVKNHYPILKNYDFIRELFASDTDIVVKDNIKIELLWGDALETIKKVEPPFDICFLDPFSPKKCPELWTEQFLKDISDKMKKGGILTTYSCASSIRKNLEKAGFKVSDGPSIGRKAPSTIAIKM